MRTDNLCKVEIYRFFHTMTIMKYAVVVPLLLFFISYINIAYLGSEITMDLVWASLTSDFPYLLALICTVIAVYVGREFRQKTINYEIMGGYDINRIALSKIITCAILIPAALLLCMLLYLGLFKALSCKDFCMRICLLFVLFFHLCSGTVFYVLLCRNTAIGGSLSFVRFFVLEAAVQTTAVRFLPASVFGWIKGLFVFNQWQELISVGVLLKKEWIIGIFGTAFMEYAVLQGLLRLRFKRMDM